MKTRPQLWIAAISLLAFTTGIAFLRMLRPQLINPVAPLPVFADSNSQPSTAKPHGHSIGISIPADDLISFRDLFTAWQRASPEDRPRAAQKLVRSLEPDTLRRWLNYRGPLAPESLPQELRFALARELVRRDLGMAADALALMPEGGHHEELLGTIVDRWAPADSEEALAWIASLAESTTREQAVRALALRWLEADPAAAADLIMLAVEHPPMRSDLLDRLVASWSQCDFEPALSWARALPDGDAKYRALIQLSYQWEVRDPKGALAYAQTLPEGHDSLVTLLASRWAKREPEVAAQWAAELPTGPRKTKVIASLTAEWAQNDPRAAGEFVAKLTAPQARQEAAISVVSAWAGRDPARAAAWVQQFPEGRLREYAIENVVYRWLQDDPQAAANWLLHWPAGQDRDVAINAGAGALIDGYPDLAVQWAAAIGNEFVRNRQTERAARSWLQIDPLSARNWIAQSSLPATLKQRLLQSPTR